MRHRALSLSPQLLAASLRSSRHRREELHRTGHPRRVARAGDRSPNPSLKVERRFYLAGSYICHQALVAGRIDAYVEYTGTALTAILKQPVDRNPEAVLNTVRRLYASRYGITVAAPLGFENTFAMVIRGDDARRLHLTTLSQAAQYTPQWRLGVGYEFEQRPDGLPGLSAAYSLTSTVRREPWTWACSTAHSMRTRST